MDLQVIPQKLVGDDEERAVSPVIGVILMVAITVILAAVIAAFVLDLGDTSDPAPTSQLGIETNSDFNMSSGDDGAEVFATLSHDGGDGINTDDITVRVEADDSGIDDTLTATNGFEDEDVNLTLEADDRFSVGDSADFEALDDSGLGEESADDVDIRIIHEPSDSIIFDRTITTAEWSDPGT